MRIVFASDHAGYLLKEEMKRFVQSEGHDVIDVGTDSADVSVDYPDLGRRAAEMTAAGEADLAVLVCGTGIGMSITANKVPGVYAALCTNELMARMSRRHNAANALVLGGRIIGIELAREIVRAWLEEEPEGGRHAARRNKIAEMEDVRG